MYTLKGNIKVINDMQQVSDSFRKREFVVTENSGQYPQDILFQAVQDRCALLDGMTVGEEVEVAFNLRGREWTNPKDNSVRYFNSLDAWKIEKSAAAAPPPAAAPPATAEAPADAALPGKEADDDLPF